jgi:hypothetical protein
MYVSMHAQTLFLVTDCGINKVPDYIYTHTHIQVNMLLHVIYILYKCIFLCIQAHTQIHNFLLLGIYQIICMYTYICTHTYTTHKSPNHRLSQQLSDQ